MNAEHMLEIVKKFQGLVVIDEAYIDFSRHESFLKQLKKHQNLIVLQTFSKAWGLAALRLGMAFADEEILAVLNMIKPPYNINGATQELAIKALHQYDHMKQMLIEEHKQKKHLETMLGEVPFVRHVYPSDANFFLVKMDNAHAIYQSLIDRKVIVRDRSKVELCEDCLRITVGTGQENEILINELKNLSS
jgi:histidinol-phosphate aminotransferase